VKLLFGKQSTIIFPISIAYKACIIVNSRGCNDSSKFESKMQTVK
jgi:hypothetical protein